MSDSGYINRAFRPEPGRKYFNHMATWTGGYWHRHWLLSSGRYIKTSEQRTIGLMQFISGPLPEYTPSHHKGAALWLPSEPGNRHWPGCGCP